MRASPLLLLLSILGPLETNAADTCSSKRADEWNDLEFNGASGDLWDCGSGSPTNDEAFEIRHALTTSSPLTMSDESGAITCFGGASWTIGSSGTEQSVVSLSPDHFRARAGCQVSTAGLFRTWGQADTTPVADPDAAGTWRAGEVVLCPSLDGSQWEEDCEQLEAGSRDEMLLFWDHANGVSCDPNEPNGLIGTSIAAIDPASAGTTRNWILFRRPGMDYSDQSYENGHWYEIVDRGDSGGGYWLKLNVTQEDMARRKLYAPATKPARAPYRQIVEFSSAADHAAAATRLSLTALAGKGIDADNRYNATWLYVGGGPRFNIYQKPLLIGWTLDGDPDTVQIARAAGLEWDLPLGESAWLSRIGVRPCDPFVVVRPVIVQSSATEEADFANFFTVDGLSSTATLFNQIRTVGVNGPSPSVTLHYVTSREGGHEPASGAGHFLLGGANVDSLSVDLEYVSATGTDITGSYHGIEIGGAPGEATVVTGHAYDVAVRYCGDDCFNQWSAGSDWRVDVQRLHVSYMTENATSGQGYEMAGTLGPGTTTTGFACLDCARNDGSAIGSFGINELIDATMVGVGRSGIYIDALGDGGFSMERISWLASPQALTVYGSRIAHAENIVVARNRMPLAAGGTIAFTDHPGSSSFDWSDVLYYDNENTANGPHVELSGEQQSGSRIHNMLLLDNDTSGGSGQHMWRFFPSAGKVLAHLMTRVTFAFSPEFHAMHPSGAGVFSLFDLGSNSSLLDWEPGMRADGLLFHGFLGAKESWGDEAAIYIHGVGPGPQQNSVKLAVTWTNGPCLEQNDDEVGLGGGTPGRSIDFRSNPALAYRQLDPNDAPTLVRFLDLELSNPGFRDFTPQPGGRADATGCGILGGADAPGIHEKGWSHWMTGTEPETAETVPITPRVTSADQSVFFVEGLAGATAGLETEFSIQARDQFGVDRSSGGDAFMAELGGESFSLIYLGNGAYRAWITPQAAGIFELSVRLDDVELAGSPIAVSIAAVPVRGPGPFALGVFVLLMLGVSARLARRARSELS